MISFPSFTVLPFLLGEHPPEEDPAELGDTVETHTLTEDHQLVVFVLCDVDGQLGRAPLLGCW